MIPSPYDQYMTGGPLPWADKPEPKKATHGWMGPVGGALGAGIGLIAGNPMMGYQIGSKAGSTAASIVDRDAEQGQQDGMFGNIDPKILAVVMPYLKSLMPTQESGPGFTSQIWNAAGGISPPSRSPLVSPGSWRP